MNESVNFHSGQKTYTKLILHNYAFGFVFSGKIECLQFKPIEGISSVQSSPSHPKILHSFCRSMFVTKADTLIANTKNDGRREVRFISLQVFLVWGTFTLLNLIVLTTNPRIPNDFYYILKCKGI